MDINIDCGYTMDGNPHLGPSSSSNSDVTTALGVNQTIHVTVLLTSFTPTDIPLPTRHKSFSLPPSPLSPSLSLSYHTKHLSNIIAPVCLAPQAGLCFLFGAQARLT